MTSKKPEGVGGKSIRPVRRHQDLHEQDDHGAEGVEARSEDEEAGGADDEEVGGGQGRSEDKRM